MSKRDTSADNTPWTTVQKFVPFSDNNGRKPLIRDGQGLLYTLLPWVGTAYLSQRVNEMWWTLENVTNILEDITTQLIENPELKAVAQMATQNRLALDAIYAEQGGMCTAVGIDHCCTYIPDSTGNWTVIRDKVRQLQNFLRSREDNSQPWSFLRWFNSGSWTHVLQRLGIMICLFLLVCSIIFCCVVPMVGSMVSKALQPTPGNGYVLVPLTELKSPEGGALTPSDEQSHRGDVEWEGLAEQGAADWLWKK